MYWSKEAKDTIWLIGLQGANYLVPLLVWPYLMYSLGAEGFGIYSFGIALAQYLMMLVDFGFNLTASKQIALAQGNSLEINRIFSSTMVAKLLLLIISFFIVIIVSVLPMYRIYRTIAWITWLMVVGNTFSMFWLFQGAGKIRLISIVNTILKVLILPLTFILVKSAADVYKAAWIQVSVYMCTGIVMVVLSNRLHLAQWICVRMADVREQLRNSWSIFLSSVATSTYTTLFVVILACLVPADEVGRYTATEKIMRSLCYLVWMPMSQAYFPRISRLGNENSYEGKKIMRRLILFLIIVLGLGGVAFAWGAEPLTVLLGKDYSGIGRLAQIMAVVPVLIAIGGVQGQMGLIAMGGKEEKTAFRNVYLAAGAIALVCVAILAYLWGAIGAAIALVITEGFVCIAMCVLENRHYHKIKIE